MSSAARGPAGSDEFRSVHAIRDALPTRAHAEMAFGMVADLLGDAAWVETWNGETTRTLFRRESPRSPWIVPWPLVSVTRGGRDGPSPVMTSAPGVYEEPKPRPGPAPKIRGLGPGSITIHDGPQHVNVCYGGDGRWFECSVSSPAREALSGVLPVLAAKNASPTEMVASFVAALDLGRHGPGRVHLPVPLPGGAQSVWNCGLFATRDALFFGRVPASARWVAVDGWTGRAFGFGATRDAAIAEWREQLARVRPFPEKPQAPAEPLPEPSAEQSFDGDSFSIRVTMRGPASDVPWVEPTLDNSPVTVMPIGELPETSPRFGEWTQLVGAYGGLRLAHVRRDRRGFTLVGDALFGQRLDDLDARLDAADGEWDERQRYFEEHVTRPEGFPEPPPSDCSVRTYRIMDERTRTPLVTAAVCNASRQRGFNARGLDAERVRWQVVRVRRD
jgi:hypothetical protein